MDTQAIGPASGPVQADVPQAGQKVVAADAPRRVEDTPSAASDVDVRPRDPRSLQFQVDSDTRQIVTTVVDDNDRTVIVQIPSEEVLRIAKAIDRMQGFLLEGKA